MPVDVTAEVTADVTVKVNEVGRLVIPASFRKALGLHGADELILHLQDNEIRVTNPKQSFRRAQAKLQEIVGDVSLADELVADRRREAAEES